MSELTKQDVFTSYEMDIEKAINHYKSELATLRAGRANPRILDKVMVDYYGNPTPLNQMANISVPEARMLIVSLWDASMIRQVSKAIVESDLGLNPSDDGKIIRLIFPALTEERRVLLVKDAKKISENCKIHLRNARRDAMDAIKLMKKDNDITEDDQKVYEKEVQDMLNNANKNVEDIFKDKEKDIMEV